MKRPWISLMIYVLVAFAVDRVIGYASRELLLRSHLRFSELYSGRVKSEVVLLGNSRAFQGFNAPLVEKRTGTGCFNLGYNALTGEQVAILGEDCLDRIPELRVMVVEVACFIEKRSGNDRTDLKSYSSCSQRLLEQMREASPVQFWTCKISHLFPFNSEPFFRSIVYLGRTDQSHGMAQTIAAEVKAIPVPKPLIPSHISPDQVETIRGLLSAAESRHVQVKLVLAPYHPVYLPAFSDLTGLILDLEQKLGHKVANYAQCYTEDEVFADRVHLNIAGKDRFTSMLIADGIISTRR